MKKGFTLIELLAVIVILAIIALIATPIILGIIKDAKDSANERSAELYLKAAELAVARESINEGLGDVTCTVESTGNMDCGGKAIRVDVANTTATGGTITFTGGQITAVEGLTIDGVAYSKDANGRLVKGGEAQQGGSSEPAGISFSYTVFSDGAPTQLSYKTDTMDEFVMIGDGSTLNDTVEDTITITGSTLYLWTSECKYGCNQDLRKVDTAYYQLNGGSEVSIRDNNLPARAVVIDLTGVTTVYAYTTYQD